jgi:adenosylcobinamide kinase/adenosylcobinamide-phosphate guanylyltransferase
VGAIFFVTGGTRSGKSTFAERLASDTGAPVVYIATLELLDDEVRDRVARHRMRRPEGWTTVEAPQDLLAAVTAGDSRACVLVDGLSVWVSNRLLSLGDDPTLDALAALERELSSEIGAILEACAERAGLVIVVSDEVGSGLVPPYPLGRAYRDLLGFVNQRVSRAADRAWLCVAGRAIELPPPIGDPRQT